MNIINPVKISYKNLMAAKWRSFLTILGIVIGVAAVIIIFSIGLSAQALILDQIKSIGSNLVGVLPGATDEKSPPASVMGIQITTLKYEDLLALKKSKNVPEAENVAGYVMGTSAIKYERESFNMSFTGATADYVDVESVEIENGRFFNSEEEINLSRVAVLGKTAAKDLFGEDDPLNKKIKIKDHSFTIVGVFKERGSTGFGFSSQDETVFIPLHTAQKIIMGIDYLGFIRVKVKSPDLIDSAIANIEATLRDQHNIDNPSDDDFSVRDMASAIETIGAVTDALRYFLLAIGTVSLLVGGVGIMNVMLIAVNQRIREVGLRKAIGALNSDIILQFLVESAAISFFGGLVGIFFGLSVSFIISIVVQKFGYSWPFLISPMSILSAAGISILIGIIFGLYPARKASKISPMEALRYE